MREKATPAISEMEKWGDTKTEHIWRQSFRIDSFFAEIDETFWEVSLFFEIMHVRCIKKKVRVSMWRTVRSTMKLASWRILVISFPAPLVVFSSFSALLVGVCGSVLRHCVRDFMVLFLWLVLAFPWGLP